jgi:tripartite-type tricarboxylate transporter receptor subunit TctC
MTRTLAGIAAVLLCSAAFAQYPNKPIRLIVPFPPGGAAELGARIFTQPLSQQLGQPILIETRPGAEGIIASEAVKKSDADGYTLYYGTATGMSFAPMKSFGFTQQRHARTLVSARRSDIRHRIPGGLQRFHHHAVRHHADHPTDE